MCKSSLLFKLLSLVFFLVMVGACSDDGNSNTSNADVDSEVSVDQDIGADIDLGPDADVVIDPSTIDWDEAWGPAPDLDTRMALFDELWADFAANYAGFGFADRSWDDVKIKVRPKIEAAQTYREFYRELSHIFYDFREGHNLFSSSTICRTNLSKRPPLIWSARSASFWGVCVTPTDDETGLVYRVEEDTPGGLRVGDEILGYDGVRWSALLEDALKLPFCGEHAAVAESERHQLINAVALNAHLYEVMDVRRGDTGEVESISTDALVESIVPQLVLPVVEEHPIACNEQLDVGIKQPWRTWNDAYAGDSPVTWGILPDTNIGYIYIYSWGPGAGEGALSAVQELLNTDGLIVDLRLNLGGNIFDSYGALSVLFDEDIVGVFSTGERNNPTDYESLAIAREMHNVTVDPTSYYEGPIAVLTGPGAISSGDIIAYYLGQHPNSRRFGLPTDGSACFKYDEGTFWAPDPYLWDLWVTRTPCAGLDVNDVPLAIAGVFPDEQVWLTREDVLKGRDTVVEAALTWIRAELTP